MLENTPNASPLQSRLPPEIDSLGEGYTLEAQSCSNVIGSCNGNDNHPSSEIGLKSSLRKSPPDSSFVEKKKVQWVDDFGKQLAKIKEFESRCFFGLQSNCCHLYPLKHPTRRKSKWIAAAVVGAVMLYKRDSRGLWAGMGALVNWGFSVGLKILLNQPRPFPAMKSDPGMPSSHSQTLFYGFTFLTLSISEGLGMNHLSFILGGLAIYFCSYLSWLRVSQKYHTRNQVVVGAVLGSLFCIEWLRTWKVIVSHAFMSFLWVRVVVVVGAAAFWMALLSTTASTFRCRTRV